MSVYDEVCWQRLRCRSANNLNNAVKSVQSSEANNMHLLRTPIFERR
jgi:hypothetical protein